MKREVLIEGILLLVISFVSAAEGIRLIMQKDIQRVVQDAVGGSFYIFCLSAILGVTGVVHLCINLRGIPRTEKAVINKQMRIRMITMIVVMVIYIFLIDIVGYLLATMTFFFLEFRAVGIKSWVMNLILTFGVTAAYYLLFIQYCAMVFPRGIFFK